MKTSQDQLHIRGFSLLKEKLTASLLTPTAFIGLLALLLVLKVSMQTGLICLISFNVFIYVLIQILTGVEALINWLSVSEKSDASI